MNELNGPGIRIVIAEDHPIVADGIVAVLETAKDLLVVGRAKNGAEAIELLKQCQPDIVLLDLRMPLVDGIEVMRWIQRSGSNARPVILTIYRGARDFNQAIKAGAKAYLLKGSSPAEILKTIRRVYQRKALRSRIPTKELPPGVDSTELKPLELDILALIVQGHDNRTIGSKLGLGTDSVKYHLRGLFSKLGVRKRAAAAREAIERGLILDR